MPRTIQRLFWLTLGVLATGCSAPPPRGAGGSAVSGHMAARPPAAGTERQGAIYRIDGAHSELRVLVYRAGALANLGHNHVLVNRNLGGSATYVSGVTGSGFTMSIPIADFSVDATALRAEEGADFPGSVPDDAKSGTLRNMASAAVLDAARHPTIELRSTAIVKSGDAITATMEADIAGQRATLTVPMTLQVNPGRTRCVGQPAAAANRPWTHPVQHPVGGHPGAERAAHQVHGGRRAGGLSYSAAPWASRIGVPSGATMTAAA